MGCTASAQKSSPRSGNLKDPDPVSAKEVKEEAGPCNGGTVPKEEAEKEAQEPDPTPATEPKCHDDVQEDTPLEVKEIHQGADKTDDAGNSNTDADVDASGDNAKDCDKEEANEDKKRASEEEQILQDVEEQNLEGNTIETVNEDPKPQAVDEQQDAVSPGSTDTNDNKKEPEEQSPDNADTKEGAELGIPQNTDSETDQAAPQTEGSGKASENTDDVQAQAAAVSDTVDTS